MVTPYTMCPMDLSGRRRLIVLALGLLLPLTACGDDAEPSPDTEPGDTVAGRIGGLEPGKSAAVVTPAGRLTVAFADPVTGLDKDQTTDLRARNAPEGGAFLPVVWEFEDDSVFREVTRVFGDTRPLQIELVVDGEKYPLTPPGSGLGKTAEYVAISSSGDEVDLEVTYDKLTQTLDGQTGEVEKGVAAGLYELVDAKLKLNKCPIKQWLDNPEFFVHFNCTHLTAIPSPYVLNTWVEPGHTWLAVRLATNLTLFATGSLTESVTSYDATKSTDLSTIDGKKALGALDPLQSNGAQAGILVWDIEGKLPKTIQVRREYDLVLSGGAGKSNAPERRTATIGGDLTIDY